MQAEYDLKKVLIVLVDPETLQFFVGIFTSIAVGLLATAFYGMLNNSSDRRVLEGIHNAGYEGLVDSVLNQIHQYGGVCFPYYRLRVKMKPSPCGNYIRVHQEYEYRKVLAGSRTIHFRFKRLSSEDENSQLSSEPNLLSEDYKRYEFFFKLNDAQFYEDGISKEEIDNNYGVSNLRVDGNPVAVSKEVSSEDTYVADLPVSAEGDGERLIQFDVEYPIDWDDYIFILYEYPAKDIRVTFDYSDISEHIDFHRVEFLGYELGFASDRGSEGGVTEISHPGWLLPKSGLIAIWYRREEKQGNPPKVTKSPAKPKTTRRRTQTRKRNTTKK